MPTAPALDRPAPRARARSGTPVLATLAAVLFTAGGLVMADAVLGDPDRIDVVIENPTGYEVTVRARAPGEAFVALGPVAAGTTKQVDSVIDQGASWVFEFAYGGVDGPVLEVTGADVASGPIEIPMAVEDELRRAGLSLPTE